MDRHAHAVSRRRLRRPQRRKEGLLLKFRQRIPGGSKTGLQRHPLVVRHGVVMRMLLEHSDLRFNHEFQCLHALQQCARDGF